jgi:sterol desaturase/sphingolipid hydroxylase (fatty acid hydroxylase superfamily)
MRRFVQLGFVPLMIGGAGGAAVWVGSRGGDSVELALIVVVAIAWSLLAERIAPYERDWNSSRGDGWRDVVHAVVNETLNVGSVAVLGVVGGLGVSRWWPSGWPFVVQVAFAIVVLDAGVTLAHWQSHRRAWLWRFHAVHHSVERMYGLNGIMKHPVHQTIEMLAGATPLVVLGMPAGVAAALVACTAIQLLLQHSNVDYRVGGLRSVLALNEGHRFHHVRAAGAGDVNFGLFTTLWDRLLGTWTIDPARRFTSDDLGIAGRRDYPRGWLAQLREPFRA